MIPQHHFLLYFVHVWLYSYSSLPYFIYFSQIPLLIILMNIVIRSLIHSIFDASTFQSLLVQLKTFYLIKLCEYFRTQAVWIYRRCNIYLDCQSVVAFSPRSRTHFRLYCHSSQPCQHCTSICVLSSLSKLYDIIWLN